MQHALCDADPSSMPRHGGRIRAAATADWPALQQLLARTDSETLCDGVRSLERWLGAGHLLVLDDGADLWAAAFITERDGHSFLGALVVRPELIDRGFEQRMDYETERRRRRRGGERVRAV